MQDMSCGKKQGLFFPNPYLWKQSASHFGASEELSKRLCRVVANALGGSETDKVKILSHFVPFVVTSAWMARALES